MTQFFRKRRDEWEIQEARERRESSDVENPN